MKASMVLRLLLTTIVIALIAGCGSRTVRQLDELKELSNKAQYGEIADQQVDCNSSDPGCDQLYLIHGMACYQSAKTDPTASAEHYDCAIGDLRRGLDMSAERTPDELKSYYQALLESIRERQDLSSSWSESAPYTQLLRTQSTRFREYYPTAPDGYYYGATAALAEANKLTIQNIAPATACELLNEARQLVERGARNPGEYRANFEQTGRQISRSLQRDCSQ
jgi:hypothetical protein